MRTRYAVVAGKTRHLSGWKKEPADHRDFKLVVPGPILPTHASCLSIFPPVNDQGQLGSCVANGSCEAFECLEPMSVTPRRTYSRLYVYYYGRVAEGIPTTEDSGLYIRTGVKTIAMRGVPSEASYPYSDDSVKFTQQPPLSLDTEAAQHKVLMYYRCAGADGRMSLQAVKASIAQGFPVVFGFNVPQNFESQECADTGILHFPSSSESYVGGHCVVAGAYDDDMIIDNVRGAVLCRNSWGPDWGCDDDGVLVQPRRGNFWMPYRFFLDAIADDGWSLRRGDA